MKEKKIRSKPKFSWSNSRATSFETCRLQYYFNYYGFYGGQEDNATHIAKQIWALKQETTIPLWSGTIVHDVIAWSLEQFRDTKSMPSKEELHKKAQNQIDEGINDSRLQKWKTGPYMRIREIEDYGDFSEKSKKDLNRRIFDSLDAFYNSETLEYILSIPAEQWLSIDDLHTIEINGVNVIAAADFAFKDEDGTVFIIDWKTGKEKPDAIKQQLLVYADLARRIWNADPMKIKLLGVFLADNARISEYEVGDAIEMKENFDKRIIDTVRGMKALIVDGDELRNEPMHISKFNRAIDKKGCFWCGYKTICNHEIWST